MTTITSILPAYNEEISIGSIVCAPASTDRTAEVAELDSRRNRFVIFQNIR